jgi:hypothetical protein
VEKSKEEENELRWKFETKDPRAAWTEEVAASGIVDGRHVTGGLGGVEQGTTFTI